MTIPIIGNTAPDMPPTPVLLTAIDAVAAAAISTQLTAALLVDGITLKALSITAQGVTMTVTMQGKSVDINQPGGWRGQGHLWVDPVIYLHVKARQAFGLPT